MNRLLKVGLRNDPDVKTLQMLLNKHLKLNPPLVVDGAFGDKTHQAVVRYQENMNLGVDGVVGPETWKNITAKNLIKRVVAPTPISIKPKKLLLKVLRNFRTIKLTLITG